MSYLDDMADPPTTERGVMRVWVEDRGWHVPSWYGKCRARGCPNAPVADLERGFGGTQTRWWAYCADHLYGRRVVDGKVVVSVHPDSQAAKRGYV